MNPTQSNAEFWEKRANELEEELQELRTHIFPIQIEHRQTPEQADRPIAPSDIEEYVRHLAKHIAKHVEIETEDEGGQGKVLRATVHIVNWKRTWYR